MDFLTPATTAPRRPSLADMRAQAEHPPDADAAESSWNLQARIWYLRSYLFMRTLIGIIGVALPIVLLLVDGFLFRAEKPARGSLSAYYHSGMRDVFVGSLCATAVFLVAYKVFERQAENLLSIVAGIAALGVALFSTGRPEDADLAMTPLQERLGETVVTRVHFGCAMAFIGCLVVVSYFFGRREGDRGQRRDDHVARRSPAFWRRFHWVCAAGICVAVAFIVVTKVAGWLDDYSLLIGEAVAVFVFGLSWLAKGLELEYLLGPWAAKPAA